MLTALLVTTVLALAASAGLFGTEAGKHLADVPEVNRTLVRQALVEEPDWQHFQLLAYSRRADELTRLRELSAPPTRAVVEYAEQAQGQAAEDAQSPETSAASPPSPATTGSIGVASAPEHAADAPATTGATESAALPLPRGPDAVAPPAATEPAPQPGGNAEVASVQAGTDATETANAPDQRKLGPKRHHGLKTHPRKRIKAVRPIGDPPRIPPAATTGFPIESSITPVQPRPITPGPQPRPNTPPQPRPNDALINARIDSGR